MGEHIQCLFYLTAARAGWIVATILPWGVAVASAMEQVLKGQPTRAATRWELVRDRLLELRDRIYASERFHAIAPRIPFIRAVARRRSRNLFDLCAGFAYTQILLACVEIGLLDALRDEPLTTEEISRRCGLTPDGTDRLVAAATSLNLVDRRSRGRFGLGPLGGPILAQPSVVLMVRHNTLLYRDLTDPLTLLKQSFGVPTAVAGFFPYGEGDSPQLIDHRRAMTYSGLMAATVDPIAEDVLSSGVLRGAETILDVGGGTGRFLSHVSERLDGVKEVRLFDLPAVVEGLATGDRLTPGGPRFVPTGGDFHRDELPGGNDAVTLIRVLLDHDEARVAGLLARVHRSLRKGGRVVVAEPMRTRGTERIADAYFGLYLRAMGRGRSRPLSRVRELLREAGFGRISQARSSYPVFASILTGIA
jgi:demethylspheroidene O-methyltransferase